MNHLIMLPVLGAGCLVTSTLAQPSLAIRFANGQSEITVAPGSQVQVRVWAMGMPTIGTQIPWTTPPGTGQIGLYQGFLSVLLNMQATGGTWSNLGVAPGHGFGTWKFPPHPSGSNINGLNIGVGFNPPVPQQEFDLFFGTLTVGSADVHLNTVLQPTGAPPQLGFEVALSGIMPFNVSHFVTTLDGSAVIHVPAPAGAIVIGFGGLIAARRKRQRRITQ